MPTYTQESELTTRRITTDSVGKCIKYEIASNHCMGRMQPLGARHFTSWKGADRKMRGMIKKHGLHV